MVSVSKLFILKALAGSARALGDKVIEYGYSAFTTTGTTKEVATQLTACELALITPKSVACAAANGQLCSDGVITTDAITVARIAGTTSGLAFYYLFIGYIDE